MNNSIDMDSFEINVLAKEETERTHASLCL